ncbi:ABC transporter substrate-binding protein [Pseudomonas sp. HMWF032]|uniref:substrate-binding periplasmic protein n=1 Tax=unclassified Pseudomonas TaxID=196821 RepID=UPI000D35DF1C|nr:MULTISPECIES: transporter substrate-binding domain-containing protein [unclassified Pseudomonas]PTS85258.1 ABC transporter substrate-binding protein [Pseudomonas sp. HMWF032]PTT84723.1 ABC transporter substrate-binding protein [Pseudomonas sp. HMWF010]WAC42908.1 transporter substrate-binding domain-containing protein [Pseudomonas sp. SL4(2022)]
MAGSAQAELRLLTEEAPPTSYSQDGELRGLAVDIVRQLIARTGDAARLELLPWTRAYALAQHQADTAIFSTVRTPEREARFQWVGPLLIGTTSFYSLKSRNLRFDSLQQAAESGPLAVPKQWYTYETLEARGFKNLYGVTSSKSMVTMLKHGRVQLIATEDLTLDAELARGGLRADQVQAHLPFMRSAYYIAFSPQTDAAVVQRWRRALDAMHKDGSFAEIFRRWMPHAQLPTATE